MQESQSELDKYLLGVTIVVALVLGGSTATGLTTELVILLLAIATSSLVCLRHMDRPIDRRVFWFMVLASLAILFQIAPISSDQIRSTQGILPKIESVESMRPISVSLGLGRTVEVAGYFLTLCLFLTAVLKLRFDQLLGLIPFFLAGVVLNLTAGLMQYSYSGQAAVTDIFEYTLRGGFFTNVNHYSTLIFTSIPIAFLYFIETNRLIVLFLYIVAALLILLAAGSTAGVLIGFLITVLSIIILFQRSRLGILTVLFGTVGLGIYGAGLWARVQDVDLGRVEFARTTLEGIRDNLPFGIGYGNFVVGYPGYERSEMIFRTYVNHAHNDYLQLVFEGGVFAAALIVIFFVLLLWRVAQTIHLPLHKAATLSILFVLIHSIVDYPLRGMGVAIPFVLFLGFLFHRGPEMDELAEKGTKKPPQELTVEDII